MDLQAIRMTASQIAREAGAALARTEGHVTVVLAPEQRRLLRRGVPEREEAAIHGVGAHRVRAGQAEVHQRHVQPARPQLMARLHARGLTALVQPVLRSVAAVGEWPMVFFDGQFSHAANKFVRLQADVTANSADDKALLKRFDLFGPPGIVFFDRRGEEVKGLRVVGFQPADRFAATLDTVLR